MDIKHTENLDLKKIFKVLRRRKWLILISLIGALTAVIIYNKIARPVYQSETTIVFEEKKGPADAINPFAINLTESFITNQIEEIKSRTLAEDVVNSLPPGVINTFPIPEEPPPFFNKVKYISKMIQKMISASSVPNSEVIKIKVKAYSPIAAKVIANTITKILQERNLEVRREETSNVRKMIEEQLISYQKKLQDAEIALKNFKESNKVTIIEKEAEEIYRRITEAEVNYNQAKSNLKGIKERLTFIQEKLSQERKDLVPTVTEITSPWAQKLKEKLVDLQIQYTTLKVQDYPENHPKMQRINRQIEETKNNLKNESLKIASGENIVDPITQIQKYMEESIDLEIQIETFKAQEKALKEVIDDYKRKLNTLPDKELHLAQLVRDKRINENIYNMLLEEKERAKIAEAEKVGNIRIIDTAEAPIGSVEPRKVLNILVAIILGLSIGIGFAFIIEFLDDSIKTVEEAEDLTQLNVLGTIPKIKVSTTGTTYKNLKVDKDKELAMLLSKIMMQKNAKSPEAEAFRTLRTNLQFSGIDSPLKSIVVTSSNPSEGKSFITANLGISTAQMGLKTLIIDADLRKPTQHLLFQKRKTPGLIDILFSTKEVSKKLMTSSDDKIKSDDLERDHVSESAKIFEKMNEATLLSQISNNISSSVYSEILCSSSYKKKIFSTQIANLDLLTTGRIPPNPSEILSSRAMKKFYNELKNHYDAIIFDTPPINVVTDAGILGSFVDASIIVIKSGITPQKSIKTAQSLMKKAHCNIIGLVINSLDPNENGYYYNYYNYYYSDGDKVKRRKRKKQHS